jgi:pantetheine-phosphate adenylyltransferase
MTSLRIGVYPGTFDPITNGHLDIIVRAAKLVDRLVVGVAVNAGKGPLFEIEERVRLVHDEIKAQPNGLSNRVEVCKFNNLTVQFAAEHGATAIIRGLRAVSDFDYEFQMSSMNARLAPDIETLCLMASDKYQFIAARLVKEIATMGGDVSGFVSPRIAMRLADRLRNGR